MLFSALISLDQVELIQNRETGEVWVPLKRVCENLGIDVEGQRLRLSGEKCPAWATTCMIQVVDPSSRLRPTFCVNCRILYMWLATVDAKRIKRDDAGWAIISFKELVASDSKIRNVCVIDLDTFHGWLMTLTPSRIKDEIAAQKIKAYRDRGFKVVADYFQGRMTTGVTEERVIELVGHMLVENNKQIVELMLAQHEKLEQRVDQKLADFSAELARLRLDQRAGHTVSVGEMCRKSFPGATDHDKRKITRLSEKRLLKERNRRPVKVGVPGKAAKVFDMADGDLIYQSILEVKNAKANKKKGIQFLFDPERDLIPANRITPSAN